MSKDRKFVEKIVRSILRSEKRSERKKLRALQVELEELTAPKDEVVAAPETATPIELYLESVTFSDGSKLPVDKGDVIVLVGPNNAGKSRALLEIQSLLSSASEAHVVTEIGRVKKGDRKDFIQFMRVNSSTRMRDGFEVLEGYRFRIHSHWLDSFWDGENERLRDIFSLRIATEDRIIGSNPTEPIDFIDEAAKNPIHRMYVDESLERAASLAFERAFGERLSVFRAGGSRIPLLVGTPPELEPGEGIFSQSYVKRLLGATAPLHKQGDGMRSFATVVIELLAAKTQKLLFVDEPEAFLHPPQAKALGELCVSVRPSDSIMFVATHSPDVLEGMLAAKGNLRVVRMRRQGKLNKVRELDAALAREIATDPLLKYFSVLQGLFHERVVICEADADCMFYSAILSVMVAETPDVLFLHSNGKQRMARMAKVLKALDVPTSAIVDVDVLNDEAVFRPLIEALGGDWREFVENFRALNQAVAERHDWQTAGETIDQIQEILGQVDRTREFPKRSRTEIASLMRAASPWGRVKLAGRDGLPPGQATKHFDAITEKCSRLGLWIVPVGELEGFCRSIDGGHGPRWVQSVLDDRRIDDDPELDRARAFVRKMWTGA